MKQSSSWNHVTLLSFIIIHIITWTLLPTYLFTNVPLDVLEGIAWGQELQWGYWKHPPLAFVALFLFFKLFNQQIFSIYLLSQITIGATMIVLYRFARALQFQHAPALLAALSVQLIFFFNYTSTEFNPNVLLLLWWALFNHSAFQAVHADRPVHFILMGLWAGLGMLTKYFMLATLFPTGLYCLWKVTKDQAWSKAILPMICGVIVMCTLLYPHILWMQTSELSPFHYALSRAHIEKGFSISNYLLHILQFVISQLWILLPTLVMMTYLHDHYKWHDRSLNHDRYYVFIRWILFAPLLLSFLWVIVSGTHFRTMWSTPLWMFIGLLILYPSRKVKNMAFFASIKNWIIGFWSLAVIIMLVVHILAFTTDTIHLRTEFPGKKIVTTIEDKWHEYFPNIPIFAVLGPLSYATNFAVYSEKAPHIIILHHWDQNPWVSKKALSKEGGIVLWDKEHPWLLESELMVDYPNIRIQEPIEALWKEGHEHITIGWAIIPPTEK